MCQQVYSVYYSLGKREGLALAKTLGSVSGGTSLCRLLELGWSGVLSRLHHPGKQPPPLFRLPFPLPFSMSPQGDNKKDLSLCLPLLTPYQMEKSPLSS